MANPVNESLTNWQPDASTSDSNLPVASSGAGIGDSQDLSGNLRLLKSEVRSVSLTMSWERWRNVRNLANTANIAFTYVSPFVFTVNDDFVTRGIAQTGRRIDAFITGQQLFGSIFAVSFNAGVTTITCIFDSGTGMNGTLSDVWFGPAPFALPGQRAGYRTLLNYTGFNLGPGSLVIASTAADSAANLPTATAITAPILTAVVTVANGQSGEFMLSGIGPVAVIGPITRGHYLVAAGPSSTLAADSGVVEGATAPPGSFALSLQTTGVGSGVIQALLFGFTVPASPPVPANSNGFGFRTVSSSAPTGGSDGDIWLQV